MIKLCYLPLTQGFDCLSAFIFSRIAIVKLDKYNRIMYFFGFIIVLTMVNSLSADVLTEILKSSFSPLQRCLQVLHINDDSCSHILMTLNSNLYPTVSTLSLEPEGNFDALNCDDFIIECEDEAKLDEYIEYLTTAELDLRMHQNKRILFIMRDVNDTQCSDDDLYDRIKSVQLNILLIRQHTDDNTSVDAVTFDAPFLNKSIKIDLSNHEYNVRLTDGLYTAQKSHLIRSIVSKNQFRISLFECPPFVIYLDDGMDGIEYRIVKEISKTWDVHILQRDFSDNISDPWSAVKDDVIRNRSDLAMCSIWLTNVNWSVFDVSQEYNSLCTTFLVPKPALVNPSQYLFLPLSKLVWIGVFVSVLITMAWLYLVASTDKLSDNSLWNSTAYASPVYCFMRVIEMATLHGLNTIPRQESFKIIITFWMVACILISTAYSSGYTSLLTCPQYDKKIETVQDMVEQGVLWGALQSATFAEWDENEYYKNIKKQRRFKKNMKELLRSIEDKNHAIFVKRLGDDYVTDTEGFEDVAKYLSCLKECIAQYFIVFALQKNSYYKQIINKRLIELLESGIIRHWQTDIIAKYKINYMNYFFEDHKKSKNQPFSLSISHTRGAFYLLMSGLLLSKLIFINEIFGIVRLKPRRLPAGDVR